ncbi:hypothetical protein HYU21_00540 [Candidatus Woesearchaeota archaeon]|nr:hypothetical protein [Candidatus Woesearchaeota archaeon]
MSKKKETVVLSIIILSAIIIALILVSCSPKIINYSKTTNSPKTNDHITSPSSTITLNKTLSTDWTLDKGWSLTNTNPLTFKGIGHTWATLNENLNGNSLMRFNLQRQKGNININIKNSLTENGLSRYILSIADGTELILQKQQGDVNKIQELTQASLPAGMDWNLATTHLVEIKTVGPQIIVRLDGQRMLFFVDTQPLMTGTLAFETIEDSEFEISDVQVIAGSNNLQEETREQNNLPKVSSTKSEEISPSPDSEIAQSVEEKQKKEKSKEDVTFNLPSEEDKLGWTQTSGPFGGTVLKMIPHAGTVWASLYSGGIYELQKDNSWKQIAVGSGIPEVRAFDIVPNPNNSNIVYVSETIVCGAKTINNGVSWQGLCNNMLKYIDSPNFNTNTLALDPTDSKIIYVPGNKFDQSSVFLVSKDGGEQWEQRFTFDKPYKFNQLSFFNSKMYLATVEDGVLVSSDLGKSWKQLNKGLEDLTTSRLVSFKNRLYLLGARLEHNVRMGGNLYRLASDGLSWEKVPQLEQVTGLGTDGITLFTGTWKPDNPNPKLWTSTDGISFQEIASQGLPHGWIGEIVNLDSKLYVGDSSEGIYVSSNQGNTFEEFNKGLISSATREVYINPDDENEIYVSTWDVGFYWSKNAGKGYRRLAEDYMVLTIKPDPHDFSKVYLGGNSFTVGQVSMTGSKFSEKNRPGSDSSFIKSIAVDPRDSNHILAGVGAEVAETPSGEGVWYSNNQGGQWSRSQGISNFAVSSIIFNPLDTKIVYASALGGGVFKSIDGGSSFTPLGVGEQLKYTYRLAMSPSDPNVLIASSNLFFAQLSSTDQYSGKYGGIFQSKDAGATWKELTKGIRNYDGGEREEDFLPWLYNFGHLPNYEMILIDPKNSDHLVVGHHGENVIETIDGGVTWKKVGADEMVPDGIHNYAYCLGASKSFKKFYACTCGRGLFRGLMNEQGYISSSLTGDIIYENDIIPAEGIYGSENSYSK